jgi:hypothetical protein
VDAWAAVTRPAPFGCQLRKAPAGHCRPLTSAPDLDQSARMAPQARRRNRANHSCKKRTATVTPKRGDRTSWGLGLFSRSNVGFFSQRSRVYLLIPGSSYLHSSIGDYTTSPLGGPRRTRSTGVRHALHLPSTRRRYSLDRSLIDSLRDLKPSRWSSGGQASQPTVPGIPRNAPGLEGSAHDESEGKQWR